MLSLFKNYHIIPVLSSAFASTIKNSRHCVCNGGGFVRGLDEQRCYLRSKGRYHAGDEDYGRHQLILEREGGRTFSVACNAFTQLRLLFLF